MRRFCFLGLLYLINLVLSQIPKLSVEYKWTTLNYTSDSLQNFSSYNLYKAVPFDIEKSQDGRLFVTVVAKKEVPISLTIISNSNTPSPLLSPYPNPSWFLDNKNCNNITNIDKCNRLWALDTGRINKVQICNASLLVFNLTSNLLIKRYSIPRNVSNDPKGRGDLVNPVLKFKSHDSCDVENIYIADPEGYALIVWDNQSFVRLSGPDFEYDDNYKIFNISGKSFSLAGGINAMELEPRENNLFFGNLASRNLSILRNLDLSNNSEQKVKSYDLHSRMLFKTQPTALRLSVENNVHFVGLTDNSIGCWYRNAIFIYRRMDTSVRDDRLQYVSSLKIYKNLETGEEDLWVLSTNLQKVINRKQKFDEINYWILKGTVKDLIKGTRCENRLATENFQTNFSYFNIEK